MDNIEKPKKSADDILHTIVKAGISSIPIAGAPAAEIFTLIVTPPYEKRRDKWIESIGDGLKKLAQKVDNFNLEELSKNEIFITTVTYASQVAIRNHQKEKLEALRNAVLNAALLNAPEEDLQLMFLNFIDSFTPWHLAILHFFSNPKEWGQKHHMIYQTYTMGSPSIILEASFKELVGRRELYDLFVKDLYSKGLMNSDSLHTMMSENGIFASRTTDIGNKFIKFITSPLDTE